MRLSPREAILRISTSSSASISSSALVEDPQIRRWTTGRRLDSPTPPAPDRDRRFERQRDLGQGARPATDGHAQRRRQHVEGVARVSRAGEYRNMDPGIRVTATGKGVGKDRQGQTPGLDGAARGGGHHARATAGQGDPTATGGRGAHSLGDDLFLGCRDASTQDREHLHPDGFHGRFIISLSERKKPGPKPGFEFSMRNPYFMSTRATRRFWARPSRVLLSAMGLYSPYDVTFMRWRGKPFSVARYFMTISARL